jgi:hypothetical protein
MGSDDMESSSVDEEDGKEVEGQLDEDGAPAVVNRRMIRTQGSMMRGLTSRFESMMEEGEENEVNEVLRRESILANQGPQLHFRFRPHGLMARQISSRRTRAQRST